MEYHPALKMNKLLLHITWMDLTDTLLSEWSQTHTQKKYSVSPLIRSSKTGKANLGRTRMAVTSGVGWRLGRCIKTSWKTGYTGRSIDENSSIGTFKVCVLYCLSIIPQLIYMFHCNLHVSLTKVSSPSNQHFIYSVKREPRSPHLGLR